MGLWEFPADDDESLLAPRVLPDHAVDHIKRVVLFIVTADPPHKAHALILRKLAALKRKEKTAKGTFSAPRFDEVWVVPCGERVDKVVQAPYPARVALAHALVEDSKVKNAKVVELDKGLSAQAAGIVRRAELEEPRARFALAFGPDNLLDFSTHASWPVLAAHELVFVVPFKSWNALAELKRQGVVIAPERVTQVVLDVRAHSRDIRTSLSEGEKVPRGMLTPAVQRLVLRKKWYSKSAPGVNVENKALTQLKSWLASGSPLESLVHPLAVEWYAKLVAGSKIHWGAERLAKRMPGGRKS